MRKFLKRAACFILVAILSFSSYVPTFADNPCSRYPRNSSEYQQCWLEVAGQNNILFYDPNGGMGECYGGGSINGNMVTVIGDSISVMSENEYKSQIPGADFAEKTYDGITYNLIQVGKHFVIDSGNSNYMNYGGMTIARKMIEHNNMREYLVFALGTNDYGELNASMVDNLMNLVGSSRKVVLVTNYGIESAEHPNVTAKFATNSEVIRAAGEKYDNVAVADWAMEVEKDPAKYIGDGWVHPNTEGSKLFVRLIKQALDSLAGVTYTNGPIAISGSTIEEKIWSGLTTFLTAEQAAGVMGNMRYESGLNPAMHEQSLKNKHQPGFDLGGNPNISYGIGLIQWSGERRVGFYNYMRNDYSDLVRYIDDYNTYAPDYSYNGAKFLEVAGEDATNRLLSAELQFLKDELNYYPTFKPLFDTNTVDDATNYFLENIEKPGDIEGTRPDRLKAANEYYERYKNYSGASCSATNASVLADYVRKYVWPEFRGISGGNFTERMPEYAQAVDMRYRNGQYVGGVVDGVRGIDCGGFITTIMQESGYDTTYNGCKSNTSAQEYWLRNSDEWEWLNPDGRDMDAADLRLGDVAFANRTVEVDRCTAGSGHTFMFIGDFDGYETNIASASISNDNNTGGRAPMSGNESVKNARWYRKVK